LFRDCATRNLPKLAEIRCITHGCPEKFSGVPDYAHGYFSPKKLLAFVVIEPMNVRQEYEVRSFTRSGDNGGSQKFLGTL